MVRIVVIIFLFFGGLSATSNALQIITEAPDTTEQNNAETGVPVVGGKFRLLKRFGGQLIGGLRIRQNPLGSGMNLAIS